MKDKIELKTKLGTLEAQIDNDEKYPGMCLTLNGVPILELEQVMVDGEYKIVLSKYPNKNVYIDDEHINKDKFHIDVDMNNKELIADILKDIE